MSGAQRRTDELSDRIATVVNTPLSRRSLFRRTALASTAAIAGGLALGGEAASGVAAAAAVNGNPPWMPANARNTFDPTTELYNYKTSNTARHLAGLQAAAGSATTLEVFVGDSITDGFTGAGYDRSDSWPMTYRSTLARTGIGVGGTGWVRCADSEYTDPRWTFAPAGEWANLIVYQFPQAVGATATYTDPMAGTTVALLFEAAAFCTFTVSVDGATSGSGFVSFNAGNASATEQLLTLSGLPDTPHTVVVTLTNYELLVMLGAMVYTPGTGLIVHNVSQGGATASGTTYTSWSSSNAIGTAGGAFGLPARYQQTPSTVWITLGANDIHQGVAPATVVSAIQTIADNFPASDIFLVLEYQANFVTIPAWTAFAQELYQLADTLDVPLFDMWAKIGGYATYSANGYAGDSIGHLNSTGYELLGTWAGSVAGVPSNSTAPNPTVNVVASSGAALTLPPPTQFQMSYVTLSANCALTFPTPVGGQTLILALAQGSTTHTVTWPSNVRWPSGTAPKLSTTSGGRDLFHFVCADAATWLAVRDGTGY